MVNEKRPTVEDLITLLWDAEQDLGDWLRYAMAARTGQEKRPPSENGSRASMAIRIRLSEAAIALREAPPPQRWYVQAAFEKRIPGRTLFSLTDAEGQDYPKNQGVIDEARAALSGLPQEPKTCGTCGGTRKVDSGGQDGAGNWIERDCPECAQEPAAGEGGGGGTPSEASGGADAPSEPDQTWLYLEDAAGQLVADLDALISDSKGVAGLHLNGDVAPWDDLCEGGRFESWLSSLEQLRRILDRVKAAQPPLSPQGEGSQPITPTTRSSQEEPPAGLSADSLRPKMGPDGLFIMPTGMNAICLDKRHRFYGWWFRKGPDGNWVSTGKAYEAQIQAYEAMLPPAPAAPQEGDKTNQGDAK
jgi:hypothetical protein